MYYVITREKIEFMGKQKLKDYISGFESPVFKKNIDFRESWEDGDMLILENAIITPTVKKVITSYDI